MGYITDNENGFNEDEESPSKNQQVTSFLGVFFPTPPLLIPHFYDVIGGLSSSFKGHQEGINLKFPYKLSNAAYTNNKINTKKITKPKLGFKLSLMGGNTS